MAIKDIFKDWENANMVRTESNIERGISDIVSAMLEAALYGCQKTRIMRRANLNYEQLKMYMRYSLKNKLIEFDTSTFLYRTTEKGKRVLHNFNRPHEALINIQSNIQSKP